MAYIFLPKTASTAALRSKAYAAGVDCYTIIQRQDMGFYGYRYTIRIDSYANS